MEIKKTSPEIHEYLINGLRCFNQQALHLQNAGSVFICFEARNDDNLIGGIKAYFYFEHNLFIEFLFVDEHHRHSGIGKQLLQQAELEGKHLGAKLVHLDTFDFQAKDFYIKNGYEVYGVLRDCPPGHKRYYMKKDL